MDNDKRITSATLEVADNGYMLRIDQDEIALVYEGTKLPRKGMGSIKMYFIIMETLIY